MFDPWRFSKASHLIILLTALGGIAIVGFAVHVRHYSEILSGVIGGLTIIFGMLTSEWMRSSREKVEITRQRYTDMLSFFERFLFNFDDFVEEPYAKDSSFHWDDFMRSSTALLLLTRVTRWPQPNAKEIRERTFELQAKFMALIQDAFENGQIWEIGKRMKLAMELEELGPLIWGRKPDEVSELAIRVANYRESPRSVDLPVPWRAKVRK